MREGARVPGAAQHVDELGRTRIARRVVEGIDAVHVEFGEVPAAGDVDRPASAGEPVQGRAPLGDGGRVKEAGMDGGHQPDALGVGREGRRHGQAVQRRGLGLGAAAPPALGDEQVRQAQRLDARDRGEHGLLEGGAAGIRAAAVGRHDPSAPEKTVGAQVQVSILPLMARIGGASGRCRRVATGRACPGCAARSRSHRDVRATGAPCCRRRG